MNDEYSESNELDLSTILAAINRRKKVAITIAIIFFIFNGCWAWYKWNNKRIYSGSATLLITDPLNKAASGMPMRGAPITNELFEDLAKNTIQSNVPMLIELLKSPGVLKEFTNKSNLKYWRLRQNLEIKALGGSKGGGGLAALKGGGGDEPGLLNISLKSDDPSKGQKILADLTQYYLDLTQKLRQKRLSDGLTFLNAQAPSLKKSMDDIQFKMSMFREKYSLVDPIRNSSYLKQRENRELEKIDIIQSNRNRLKQVRNEIIAGNVAATRFTERVGDGRAGAALQISDIDQSMLQQLLRVETELGAARSKYRADSSIVQGLNSRLENLKPMLLANQLDAVDAALKLNSIRLTNAKDKAQSINEQFKENDMLISKYEILQSELNIARSKMAGIENAREKFRLKMAQISIPWSVLNPPYFDPAAISPNPKREIVVGGILGLILGCAAGYLLDRRENMYHNPKLVSKRLKLPLLAHISHFPKLQDSNINSDFILSDTEESSLGINNKTQVNYIGFEKQFRRLYTVIRSFVRSKSCHCIVISSSIRSEGKSLINTLLAKTISEMGHHILLIDANVQNPKLHTWFGLKNENGLSDLLIDKTKNWQEIVHHVNGDESLSVITTGKPTADPTLLFSSSRIKEFIYDLKSSDQFDHILIDTPPDLEFVDSSLVAESCDGVILLVSLRKVKEDLVKETVRRIKESEIPLMGLITNSIEEDFKASDTNNYIYAMKSSSNTDILKESSAWRRLRDLQRKTSKWFKDRYKT